VNYKIKNPKVRCIGPNGEMAGVMATRDALKLAEQSGMDLVEISPDADPPVCRVMDYGKFRYLESLKEKEARKNQHNRTVKEVKFHCNVGDHDYQTKVNHAKGFLAKGHKVKLSLQFRGRENVHRELGFEVMSRVIKDCEGFCVVEQSPRMMGRSLLALLGIATQKHHHVPEQRPAAPRPQPPAAAAAAQPQAQQPVTAPEPATTPVPAAQPAAPATESTADKKTLDTAG